MLSCRHRAGAINWRRLILKASSWPPYTFTLHCSIFKQAFLIECRQQQDRYPLRRPFQAGVHSTDQLVEDAMSNPKTLPPQQHGSPLIRSEAQRREWPRNPSSNRNIHSRARRLIAVLLDDFNWNASPVRLSGHPLCKWLLWPQFYARSGRLARCAACKKRSFNREGIT